MANVIAMRIVENFFIIVLILIVNIECFELCFTLLYRKDVKGNRLLKKKSNFAKKYFVMKYFVVVLSFVMCCMKCVAQTYIEPVFDRTDEPSLHINKIEVTKDTTFIHCTLTMPPNSWGTISDATYLYNYETHEKHPLLKCDGLPISPQKRDFTFGGVFQVSFYFPSIPDIGKLDFIENPNKKAFNIYGVDVSKHYDKPYTIADFNDYYNMSSICESDNDTIKALEYKQKSVDAIQYIDGVKSIGYLGSFLQKCIMYIGYGFHQNAIDEIKKVLTNVQGDSLAGIAYIPTYKFYIGLANMQMKKEQDALHWFNESYADFQNSPDKNKSYFYGCLLNNMSNILSVTGDFNSAYHIAEEACLVGKEQFGEDPELYASALLALSNAEIGLNKSVEALAHLETAVQLSDSIHMDVTTKQNIKDKWQILQLKFQNLKQSDDVSISQSISDNSWFLDVTNDYTQGNYNEAITKLKNQRKLYEENWGKASLGNYILVITSLSNVFCEEGEYIEADKVLDESLLFLQKENVQSDQIKSIYEAKGYLSSLLNNVEMALEWYMKAFEIYKKNNDKSSLAYARLMSNLAACIIQVGNPTDAKELLEYADSIYMAFYDGVNDGNSDERLMVLNNMATIYAKMKDFPKAKELYGRIIEDESLSQNEGVKALAYMNIGEIYFLENDYKRGEECFVKVMGMDAASYVKDMAELDLYVIHCLTKNEKAISEIEQYNNAIRNHLADIFSYFSEAEREEYWEQKSGALVALNNLAATSFDNPQTKRMAFNNAIYTKCLLLKSGRLIENLVKECDQAIQETYTSMQSLKELLVNKRTPRDSIGNYVERINLYEKQVIAAIPDFSERLSRSFKSIDDVRTMLKGNDVAIEFTLLPKIKMPIEESKALLGALILTSNSNVPTLIPLCSEDELEELFDSNNLISHEFIDSLYDIPNKKLYQMIWGNIEPYIENGASVYYSPTSYINKINISAISDGTMRLSDKYDLYEVSTTAMIESIKQQKKNDEILGATLYGDIDYFEDAEMMATYSKRYTSYSSGALMATRSLDRGTWDLLPSTKDEIASIESLLKNRNARVQVFMQNEANEESFKTLSTNVPDIIHVATHGFYFPSEDDVTTSFFSGLSTSNQNDNSLLYSGLLFAGANNVWTGKTLAEGVEDGILTADEISRLDLTGNKLTVLSACETGLGDVDNVNGVYGLQRGFKKAGAGTILMSLWKVPDEETKQLMSVFYEHYLSGESAHQALKIAQQKLKDQGKSPYCWAGFVLLD